jgi:hypothetical protein
VLCGFFTPLNFYTVFHFFISIKISDGWSIHRMM